jgi:autotransporter translocation and assembly factor TamB
MSPGQLQVALAEGSQYLAHDGGSLDLTIDPGGLDARLQLDSAERRLVEADLQLPSFDRLPLPELQPLTGRIRAEIPDLSGLQALVPAVSATRGRLDADLRLAGTLSQPLVFGEFDLAGGAADIPLAGLQLREIELQVRGEPESGGTLDLTGGLVSGPGRIDLDGRLDLLDRAVALNLKGDRLQVYNTPDARALVSPDLRIGWSDEVLTLRGRVLVPEADITPRLGLSPGLATDESGAQEAPGSIIAPSPDVVVVSAEGEVLEPAPPTAPFQLDNQVELILGDRVKVNAVGFASRLTGAVTFTNQPGQKDLIPTANGRLSIEDGTFRAFGQDLQIEVGQVIFPGGPVTEPELNVRAVRWIDNDPEVSAAGVVVSGTARELTLDYFSRPQRDLAEIQSYLLTGRSFDETDMVLSVGTYLRPKLYVGYGFNLVKETNQFNALYSITPRYGVEASVGEADNTLNLTFTYER